jgi:hypothetical protein
VYGEGNTRHESRVNDRMDTQDNRQVGAFGDRQQQRYSSASPGNFGTPVFGRGLGLGKSLNLRNMRKSSRSLPGSRSSRRPSSLRQLASNSLTSYMDHKNRSKTSSPTTQPQIARAVDYNEDDYSRQQERVPDYQSGGICYGGQPERPIGHQTHEGSYNRQEESYDSRYPERRNEDYSELEDTQSYATRSENNH